MTAVIDGQDSDNWMRISVGFRRVRVTILIVDPGRAADLVMDGS